MSLSTPRTDAYEYKAGWAAANYGETWKPMAFARALEIEMNAENELLTARAEKAEKQFKILNETLQHVTAMYDNAMTRAERADAELAAERARGEKTRTALKDAISTYFGADKLVTAERIEAWQAAL